MIKVLNRFNRKAKKEYTDVEVIIGLQQKDKAVEEWFYHAARRYYDEHFNQVFFDKDKKQEIYQMAFLKLWTEISNGKIKFLENAICRQQKDGLYKQMTCRLLTFLMAFATNEYRELIRTNHLDTYAEVFENVKTGGLVDTSLCENDDLEEQKNRAVDDCLQEMSPRCIEILTLFYYQEKSLDEILEIRGDHNTSKNGLKTAKNKCMNSLRDKVKQRLQVS